MKKTILIIIVLLLLVSNQAVNCQIITYNDSLKLNFKKTKKISNSYLHTNVKFKKKKNKEFVRILIRCDLKALYKQPVDINSFSLLDEENKIRYRIASYFGYKKGPSLFTHGDLGRTYLKRKILNKRGKQYKFLPKYDESISDSFDTFTFNGYTKIEIPMNFGSSKSNKFTSVIYYSPSQKPNFRADMQFVIITNKKVPKLKLYYGNTFIADIKNDF